MVDFSTVLSLGMLIGLGAVFLIAAIVAFRGRRYWGSWLMLIGTILQFVGVVVFSVGYYYWMQTFVSRMSVSMTSGSGASTVSPTVPVMPDTTWAEVLMYGGLLTPLGFLLFGGGLISVCNRFGSLEKRAAELEVFNRQLQERIQE